ncbi:hypothetical protein CAAN1_02S07954 [[Candida] anglica]|uniref:Uncharacterized protein n=1 Tax=[Candida] anglica TaxID=148631 RepID=A0ABP0EEJ3_9ASCO
MSTRSGSSFDSSASKRRKLENSTRSDALDPVEKLLSFANRDDDFFNTEDSEPTESYDSNASSTDLVSTHKRMLDANMKVYYSQSRQRRNNDNSSFSILTEKKPIFEDSYHYNNSQTSAANQVPFFRAVNFNPKPASSYTFDEYLSYDELTDDNDTEAPNSDQESLESPTLKFNTLSNKNMSFHYRHNDNLNLSLSLSASQPETLDVFKALNKRCILNGKASEMVSTGNMLINDFFL